MSRWSLFGIALFVMSARGGGPRSWDTGIRGDSFLRSTKSRRIRKAAGGLAASTLLAALLVSCSIEPGPGSWDPVRSWPIVAIHMSITPGGDVVSFGTDANGVLGGASAVYDVWDPTPACTTPLAIRPRSTCSVPPRWSFREPTT